MQTHLQYHMIALLMQLLGEEFTLPSAALYRMHVTRNLLAQYKYSESGKQMILAVSDLITSCEKNEYSLESLYKSPKYLYLLGQQYPFITPEVVKEEFTNFIWAARAEKQATLLGMVPTLLELETSIQEEDGTG